MTKKVYLITWTSGFIKVLQRGVE